MHPRGLTCLFLCLPASGDEPLWLRCEVGTRGLLVGERVARAGCTVGGSGGDRKLLLTVRGDVVVPKISF